MRPRRTGRTPGVLAVALLLLVGGACSRKPSPGVVLITVDTLRASHLGCYGSARPTSPAMDALAASGVTFRDTFAPRAQTWPTLATVLTSLHPVTHGVRRNGQALEDGAQTIAEVLAKRGYDCASFLSNSGKAEWPGFSVSFDMRDQDASLATQAAGWLRARQGGNFFLWIHLFGPHRPFQPPVPLTPLFDRGYDGPIDGSIEQMDRITAERRELPETDLHHLIARYDAEIVAVDRLIGRLLETLQETGLDDNTLVVLASDHGEDLYQRNFYINHSASIYDSSLRIPLMLRWPGKVPAGRIAPGIVEALDIAPTVLDYLGISAPDAWEGVSLRGLAEGSPGARGKAAAFSELENRVLSVRTESHRFVSNPSGFAYRVGRTEPPAWIRFGERELFLIEEDPEELVNHAGELPEMEDELEARLRVWCADHDWEERARTHETRHVPEEIRRSLEAIGYVQ
ncbi:MAG: sulfatase [Gemmatimonadota bacterium]|nr:sulfatase [Gemmatimonadota bacterium]MDP6802671.1 sulfatase [Gemmatimonadota bacterium]MDP7031670.1 sulfatase [Gemmatimonadota bacterium]